MPLTRYLRAKVPLFALQLLLVICFFPLLTTAQLKTISGTVTDESGAPVQGVSVMVKGTVVGTNTDSKGIYKINALPGATLVFSSTSYETIEQVVGDRTELSVTMKLQATALGDVVVVGYGRQKKVNLVGAVGTVNVDDKVLTRTLPNVSSALSGMVPGLAATQATGMTGRNGANLLIRGLGTVNNSGPLIVVDGMPDVDINRINVNDIETISVLKDATSASVYGSRAANGVILITTRTGKGAKKTAINFNSNMALLQPTKAIDYMADYPRALTLHQWKALVNTDPAQLQFKNGTIDQWMALGMIDPLRYPNTDWWNIVIRDGAYQNYNLSATGGNDKSNFFASVGVRDEQGLQINNDYKQYNARFNFDYKVRSNMNTGVRFNGNWSKFTFALEDGFTDNDGGNFDMQFAIAGITPYDPVSNRYGGVMAYGEDPQAYNPYTVYVNNLNRQERQELNTMMYWDWTPLKGLTATLDYSLNYYNQFAYSAPIPNQAYNFQLGLNGSRVYVGPNAGISNNTQTGYKTMLNGRLNYHLNLGGNHDINALVVYSEEYWYNRSQSGSRNDRIHPILNEIDAALTEIQSAGGNSNTEGLRSYISRVNYTAFNKYLLEANFRVDGSSKFLPGHQYGFFPSVAVGWRFTEEEFLMPIVGSWLNNGKLRVSYGALGNNSGVTRYEQRNTLAFNPYIIGGQLQRGFVNSKMVNTDLSWENTRVFNAGLELGFLNNRLTAELDFYDRLTTDMLRPSEFSILLSGAYSPAPRRNIGEMRNRGIEGTFSWKDNFRTINYGITLNASYNATILEKWNEYLGRGDVNSGANIFIDMPYNYVYAYEAIGIAQTWQDVYNATPQSAAPGDILRKDQNGDGRIDANDMRAYTNIQRDRPTTFVALNGYASWKNFDLAFMFQGATGRKDFWLNNYNNVSFANARYAPTWNHWTNPWSWDNRNGEWPRLGGSNNQNTGTTGAGMNTFWLDDMSYIRFKNIQVGYSLPKNLLRRVGVNNLRIAGSAENLLTVTSYRGLDPEKTGNNNDAYPIVKSYALSVQLGL